MISLVEALHRQVRGSAIGRALTDAAIVRLASAQNFSLIPDLLDQLAKAVPPTRPEQQAASAAGTTRRAAPGARTSIPREAPAASADERRTGGNAPIDTQVRRSTNVSAQVMRTVRSDPLVSEAVRRFDGTLFSVQPLPESRRDTADAPHHSPGEQQC
jgi:hypothetical protein